MANEQLVPVDGRGLDWPRKVANAVNRLIRISGTGSVTSVSVTTANGVSGSVANATTTPAISLSLGAITPTSVTASGTVTGSNLSGTNTGDQTTITGNAGTATKLLAARNINGVAFDGTAPITINAVDATARVPTTTTISTTAPLAGGGALSGNLTLTIGAASGSVAGTMSASDFTKLAGVATGATANTGTVTSASVVTANGVSASVATATTTPAFTFSLGAITPTSVAASGVVTGSNLSGTNTGDQTTITGNAGTSTTLQTARNFSISGGGITAASVSFNGSAAVVLNASVDAGHITLARMANLAANSIIGNNTGSGAVPIALTPAQVKALLAIANTDVSGLGTMATQNTGSYVPVAGGAYTGTVEFRSNITYIGPAVSTLGSGGNVRFRDDSGTSRFLLGFLGGVGATSLTLYDIVNGNIILTVTSTGAVQLNLLATYASDAAAGTAGLTSGTLYKTSDGAGGFYAKVKA